MFACGYRLLVYNMWIYNDLPYYVVGKHWWLISTQLNLTQVYYNLVVGRPNSTISVEKHVGYMCLTKIEQIEHSVVVLKWFSLRYSENVSTNCKRLVQVQPTDQSSHWLLACFRDESAQVSIPLAFPIYDGCTNFLRHPTYHLADELHWLRDDCTYYCMKQDFGVNWCRY